MYVCELCFGVSQPRDKQIKRVVETRERIYYDTSGRNKIGEGREIVKEQVICASCVGRIKRD